MTAMPEGSYSCRLEPEHDYGGTCVLDLEAGHFTLSNNRYGMYSTAWGDVLSGTYGAVAGGILLRATENRAYNEETTRRETITRVSHRIGALFAGPEGNPAAILSVVVDAWRPEPYLLVREDRK
jgi:hypothetical protein